MDGDLNDFYSLKDKFLILYELLGDLERVSAISNETLQVTPAYKSLYNKVMMLGASDVSNSDQTIVWNETYVDYFIRELNPDELPLFKDQDPLLILNHLTNSQDYTY